jgi:diguanylate cyclase (GGDEF)-like protein
MTAQDDDNNSDSDLDSDDHEEVIYPAMDGEMSDFERTVEVNERMLHQLQSFELMLLDAVSLAALLDVLLHSTLDHFALHKVNLHLHDPEGAIAELLGDASPFGDVLQLTASSFDLQQIYREEPQVERFDSSDERALLAMPGETELGTILALPLMRDGHLVGSFHLGARQAGVFGTALEVDLISHLAAIVAICLENCSNSERLSQLSLLDPLTRLGNKRSFGMELRKEISRAQRNQKSLSLLYVRVDDFHGIAENFGHLAGDFVIKAISASVAEMLRKTDHIARCKSDLFGLLLPACSEVKGQELAERMRSETEFMEINDNRGTLLYASLGIGMTCWNPQTYPAINMEQLAEQMLNSARQALARATDMGGNRVSVTRLTTMFV